MTLLVEASTGVPLKITANTGNVALRWPKSIFVNALIDLVKGPDHRHQRKHFRPARLCHRRGLFEQMGDRLPLIIDAGETPGNLASTIVKLEGDDWTVMREGVISEELIRAALEEDTEDNASRQVSACLVFLFTHPSRTTAPFAISFSETSE